MAQQPVHSKILSRAAKHVLGPLGIYQKGRSRTWLDDLGWRLTVIEFQPSSWSRGSYLNVGVMWLWKPQDYHSFDLGYRVECFVEFQSETQFAQAAESLAIAARDKVEALRNELPTIHAAADVLLRNVGNGDTGWSLLNAGIACALAGRQSHAMNLLSQLINEPCTYPWERDRCAFATKIHGKLANLGAFRQEILSIIRATRQALKLQAQFDVKPAQIGISVSEE